MLTRLKVSGFKNLVDVDVRFGPFTCIAGPNGVGKSNLFDAILFLGALADHKLDQAAAGVRCAADPVGDVRAIFHRVGGESAAEMRFEADLIIPASGTDELGQKVDASASFVRYGLRLGLRGADALPSEAGPIEILSESLTSLRLGEAQELLGFPSKRAWRESVLRGGRKREFISTEEPLPADHLADQIAGKTVGRVVGLHQDGRSGRLLKRSAANLPRTLLSTVQTGEYPTAMLVRREMQSWRQLHLESSALRKSDPLTAPVRMGNDGAHLAAALHHLARRAALGHGSDAEAREAAVYASIANRLSELIDDVRDVSVTRDEAHQRFVLHLRSPDGTDHQASALSDGTLRFLALAVTEFDSEGGGVVCFEEPENGIHPRRIPAMLRLLEDIATDPSFPVGDGNPLRQVIVNTHSPAVVLQAPEDSVLIAESVGNVRPEHQGRAGPAVWFKHLQLGCLPGTWRATETPRCRVTSKASLLAYLNPTKIERDDGAAPRVLDRSDMQMLLRLPKEG